LRASNRSTGATFAGLAALCLVAGPARAELPVGWEVEIFAGRIVDMVLHDGVVLGATDGGLLFHDVVTQQFTQIADASCPGDNCLRSNQLTAVDVDAQGKLWVGARSAGVTMLRRENGGFEYRHFFSSNPQVDGGLLSDEVLALDAWRDEAVYVATASGVAQIDLAGAIGSYNDAASRRLDDVDLPATGLHDIAVDSTFVWLATDIGVVRYTRLPDYGVEVLSDSLVSTRVNVIEMIDEQVFIGTQDAVYRWDEGGGFWERVRNVNGGTPAFPVRSLARLYPTGDDRLWLVAGSDTDVWLFQRSDAWSRCSPLGLFLLQERTFPAMVASGDTLWTSQGNGFGEGAFLERLVLSQTCASWRRFEPSNIPPSAVEFVDLHRGPDRTELWVALNSAGVARRGAGTWCAFNANDPVVAANMTDPEGHASAFRVDRGGSVWFTTLPINQRTTVDRLDADPDCAHGADLWDHIPPAELDPVGRGFEGRYWKIDVDGEGNRFFLADEAGVGGLEVLSEDGLEWANLRDDLLGSTTVGAIAFDKQSGAWDKAWLGMNNLGDRGLVLWRRSGQLFDPGPTNFRTLPLEETSITAYRDMVFHARHQHLWIGTDAGLIQYDTVDEIVLRTFGQRSTEAIGLLSPKVTDLLLDDRDNLWIATASGLNRINVSQAKIVDVEAFSTAQRIDELNADSGFRLYDDMDVAPLPAPEVTSLAYDPGGRLLHIGTERGLATLDVEAFASGPVIPIEQALVFPNPVRPLSEDPLDPTARISVYNVTTPAQVTIYNLEGQIVATKEVNERTTEEGVEVWNLKIETGTANKAFDATSGVYFVRIDSPTGSTVTPIVVIR
jgi:ligand-binding sensor domain-containing protein